MTKEALAKKVDKKEIFMKSYSKTPSELLEALAKTKLSGYEFRLILVVLRKTYGWNKESDFISTSQFVKETGIKKWHIWRTKKRLLWRKIITQKGNKLSINTNYGEWRELPKGATVTKSGIKVANPCNKVAQIGGHKEYSTNEIIQKKEIFSKKEIVEAYKKGDRKFKPYFWGHEMRWSQGKWWVIEGREWKEFVGSEEEIEFKKRN
jgi:phage replication O-like protein O